MTITGSGGGNDIYFDVGGTNFTFDAGTSLLKFNINTLQGGSHGLIPGGQTFYDLEVRFAHTNSTFIKFRQIGSATFRTFSIFPNTSSGWSNVTFDSGTTITTQFFNALGTAAKIITLGAGSSTNWNIIKTGGGVVSCDYLSILKSTATPGSTWYAGANSIDAGGNSGWIFTVPPTGFTYDETIDETWIMLDVVEPSVQMSESILDNVVSSDENLSQTIKPQTTYSSESRGIVGQFLSRVPRFEILTDAPVEVSFLARIIEIV